MKVYFDTSSHRNSLQDKSYRAIHDAISELGFKHLFNDIVDGATLSSEFDLSEEERKKYEELYRKRLRLLRESDINVFDATVPSISVGLLIEKSLELSKPTVVFYLKGHPPVLISGIHDDKLILQEYTPQNCAQSVKMAMETARHSQDKRFNFFISPELLDYLEQASTSQGITKSTFIRQLILKHMRKNK